VSLNVLYLSDFLFQFDCIYIAFKTLAVLNIREVYVKCNVTYVKLSFSNIYVNVIFRVFRRLCNSYITYCNGYGDWVLGGRLILFPHRKKTGC